MIKKFKYNFETDNGMWVVKKERLIKLNAKKYNLSLDFSEMDTIYAKRDSIVFITYKEDNDIFQIIVNNNTDFDKSPIKELTDSARMLVGIITGDDLLEIFKN